MLKYFIVTLSAFQFINSLPINIVFNTWNSTLGKCPSLFGPSSKPGLLGTYDKIEKTCFDKKGPLCAGVLGLSLGVCQIHQGVHKTDIAADHIVLPPLAEDATPDQICEAMVEQNLRKRLTYHVTKNFLFNAFKSKISGFIPMDNTKAECVERCSPPELEDLDPDKFSDEDRTYLCRTAVRGIQTLAAILGPTPEEEQEFGVPSQDAQGMEPPKAPSKISPMEMNQGIFNMIKNPEISAALKKPEVQQVKEKVMNLFKDDDDANEKNETVDEERKNDKEDEIVFEERKIDNKEDETDNEEKKIDNREDPVGDVEKDEIKVAQPKEEENFNPYIENNDDEQGNKNDKIVQTNHEVKTGNEDDIKIQELSKQEADKTEIGKEKIGMMESKKGDSKALASNQETVTPKPNLGIDSNKTVIANPNSVNKAKKVTPTPSSSSDDKEAKNVAPIPNIKQDSDSLVDNIANQNIEEKQAADEVGKELKENSFIPGAESEVKEEENIDDEGNKQEEKDFEDDDNLANVLPGKMDYVIDEKPLPPHQIPPRYYEENVEDSNLMTILLTVIAFTLLAYLVIYNKHRVGRIIAVVIEGRRRRAGPRGRYANASYKKVGSGFDDTLTSNLLSRSEVIY
ncbi:uncharacterized protein LOC136036102 isoform X1 [Artemia franciscana]|uniref:uncharacterized protein LOC136036102 isoform X1 n=1 Tax=Artemia franciscana TaxID=6661 RepID=UPI0032DA50F5